MAIKKCCWKIDGPGEKMLILIEVDALPTSLQTVIPAVHANSDIIYEFNQKSI